MKLLRVGPAGRERPAVPGARGTAYDPHPPTTGTDCAFLAGGVGRVGTALAEGVRPGLDDDLPRVRGGDVVEFGIDGPGRQHHVPGRA
ncbi:hypothetical protein FHX81_1443 [Saccharothrix saharensis]|uniref:Uncharacterized protein n=1 Tax=Saccharothrix saharensis TaxID=571190 RepID=A0A543J8K8_9PSEU|nr:hypothetical protein [Saccharothrix saharensis]TQM79148.1 hypothetical protein FHX81_1443 [Saccharothrix saharensis]